MENLSEDQINHLKNAIEAILFISDRPVMLEQIKDALETVSAAEIKSIILALKKDLEDRQSGVVIAEIAEGYQMLSSSQYAGYIRNFYKVKHKEKLSKPSLETLAIVAYKQPVSRGDIELVRGVNSDGVVAHLLNKELIKVVGRKDVPGKPYIYGTTKQFLEYFGLRSLSDLPKLEEFIKLQPVGEIPASQTDEEKKLEQDAAQAQSSQPLDAEKIEQAQGESEAQAPQEASN